MSYRTVLVLIGICVFIAVISLVRKARFQEKHAIWWIFIALAVLVCSFFPSIIDCIGRYLGIHYPPIFLLVIAACLILIKLLSLNISISDNEVKIKELAQRLAIMEKKLTDIKKDEDTSLK